MWIIYKIFVMKKTITKYYVYQHVPEIPVNHPGRASEWEIQSVSCQWMSNKYSKTNYSVLCTNTVVFGDQQCHVTLSQVSSSALSHSKAFQFKSSAEKDINFK